MKVVHARESARERDSPARGRGPRPRRPGARANTGLAPDAPGASLRARRLVVATGDAGPAASAACLGGQPGTPVADDASAAGGGGGGGGADPGAVGLYDGLPEATRKARLLEAIVLGEPPPDCGWQGEAATAGPAAGPAAGRPAP